MRSLLLLLCACGTRYGPPPDPPPEVVTVSIDAELTLPDGCSDDAGILAEATFFETDQRCELETVRDGLVVHAHGVCDRVLKVASVTIVVSYLSEDTPRVIVGESVGRASFEDTSSEIVIALDASVAPKTKADDTELPSERVRFNCDIAGFDECSVTNATPKIVDTCSNLEELCLGILRRGSIDRCE